MKHRVSSSTVAQSHAAARFVRCAPGARRMLGLACVLGMVQLGCDSISKVTGAIAAAKDVTQNLQADLEAPLDQPRIDKVLQVIPELDAFQKEAKVKWKPNPDSPDFAQLATSLTGLTEYIAFFESHDTRLTQFYVDVIKISDARAQIEFAEGEKKSRAKLEADIKATQKKLDAAKGKQKESLERKLKRLNLTLEKLDKLKEGAANPPEKPEGSYTLTDAEKALVKSQLPKIQEVFNQYGYGGSKRRNKNKGGNTEATSEQLDEAADDEQSAK